ncbi:MAG: GLPGLI family protein [Saprospiraceae bacterium]
MKKITLLLCCLLGFSLFINAQNEGEVLFQETMKIEIKLPEGSGITAEQLKKMMPSERVSKYVLSFNETATLYKAKKGEEPEDQEFNSDNGEMRIKMRFSGASADNATYLDLKKETLIEKKDFMGKTFLVQDKDPKLPWKLGTETKMILDYNCRKASAEIDDRTIEAWFTTELPIASGPGSYFGLPGMILEVSSDGKSGKRHLMATEVNLKTLEADQITAPKKGKKVSSEAFKKIVEEKTKEMQEQMGSGGNRIIIRG